MQRMAMIEKFTQTDRKDRTTRAAAAFSYYFSFHQNTRFIHSGDGNRKITLTLLVLNNILY
jgi:hypothetical protein